MKKYLISNPVFEGEVMVLYINGELKAIDFTQANMDAMAVEYFKNKVPVNEQNLKSSFKPETIIVACDVQVRFEEFWQKYNHKFNRARAEALWDRLSKSDQVVAFYALDAYHKYLRKHPTQAKLHPDSYLRTKAFNNDYR